MRVADAMLAFGQACRSVLAERARPFKKDGNRLYCKRCGALLLLLTEDGFDTASSVYLSLRGRKVLVACSSCHRYGSYILPKEKKE